MKAYFVKDVSGEFRGEARLYRLEPPFVDTDYWDEGETAWEYVVSSAANTFDRGPETFIFGSDDEGNVTNWGELKGSATGWIDCDKAIRDMGYEVV